MLRFCNVTAVSAHHLLLCFVLFLQLYIKQISNHPHTWYMVPKSSMEPSELGLRNRCGHISLRIAVIRVRCYEREWQMMSCLLFFCHRRSWNMKMSSQRTWSHHSSLRILQKRSDCLRYFDFILDLDIEQDGFFNVNVIILTRSEALLTHSSHCCLTAIKPASFIHDLIQMFLAEMKYPP